MRPGRRANATIGRALSLIWSTWAAPRPGVISTSTFGNPAQLRVLPGEYEEESGCEPLHVEHGFSPGDSTVAALAGEPLQILNDTKSRGAADLLTTIARSLQVVAHHKGRSLGDTLVVVGPEHARTIANDGWSKRRVRQFLWEQCRKPVRHLLPGRDGGDGLPERTLASYSDAANDTTLIQKFRAPENLKLVVNNAFNGSVLLSFIVALMQ